MVTSRKLNFHIAGLSNAAVHGRRHPQRMQNSTRGSGKLNMVPSDTVRERRRRTKRTGQDKGHGEEEMFHRLVVGEKY